MKIILNQDVVLYNKTNAAIFASRAAQIEKRKAEKRAQSASLKEKLDATVVNLVVTAGESGKLFGSITAAMVQEALSKQGIEVERKKIEVATHAIKMVGTYSVVVHLYENEVSHVKLVVESEAMVKERKAKEAREKAEAEAKAKAEAEAAEKAAEEAATEAGEEAEPAEEAQTGEEN